VTCSGKILKHPVLRDPWRLSGWHVTSGHAFERLVPAKEYAEAHPDYFSPKQKQPCLTQWSKHGNVAQTFSLPYRRFSTCQPAASATRGALPITNLRYAGRPQLTSRAVRTKDRAIWETTQTVLTKARTGRKATDSYK